jgi:hypothetical protein
MADTPKFTPMPGATGFIHHVDEAPAYWMQGILWTMLADAADTGGRWSMMEQLLPRGSGPPPHKHLWSDETFYILDGTITFLLDAAVKAGVPRFISSDFAADFTKSIPGRNRNFDLRRAFMARVDTAPIRVTSILNGAFLDMLGAEMPIIQPRIHRVLLLARRGPVARLHH